MNSFEKPFFSNKVGDIEEITLIEEGKVVSEGKEVLETFKSYFQTIVESPSLKYLQIKTSFPMPRSRQD